MPSIKSFYLLLIMLISIMLYADHFVHASIIVERVHKESPQDKVLIFEAITTSEEPFVRRSDKEKKDQSGSNSDSSSGTSRGPNLPPQPSRNTVRPDEIKKVLPDNVWQPLSKSIEQTVKKHLQDKKGGNGSNQQ